MIKLKGKYAYELQYHQDASALVVPKVAVDVMVNGVDLNKALHANRDPYDFCLRAKVQRGDKLVLRYGEYASIPMQKITRYFVSNSGGSLVKIAPARGTPGQYKRANKLTDEYFNSVMNEIGAGVHDERIHTKNKSVYDDNVETCICAGFKATECNDMKDFDWLQVNYNWYEKEIKKLIIEE